MRKLLLNIHLYAGLLCFSYLIIFGISSLNFNHPFPFTRALSEPVTWTQSISVPDLPRLEGVAPDQLVPTKARANHMVREALGLIGHQKPWKESYWKDSDVYHASLTRPGKTYEVDYNTRTNLATVTETRTSVWAIMKNLHGFHGMMPGSPFVSSWSIYTELCTLTVLFAGGSGIYLWTRRRRERRAGLIALASAFAFSIALMIYITL
jgi:hypothetical protein